MVTNDFRKQLEKIITAISSLKSRDNYFVDPYDFILSKFEKMSKIEISHLSNEDITWIKYTVYRLVYEAPIDDLLWRELLNDIEKLRNLIP